MVEKEVIIGRKPFDVKRFGTKGTILLGKEYVEMENESVLGGDVYLDVSNPHVIFVCGKRGAGKSYTLGVLAEGFGLLEKEIRNNLSIILLDTMGIYWTMSHANKKEADLLKTYKLSPKAFHVNIFTPLKYHEIYKKKGLPTDFPLMLNPAELNEDDWCLAFKQEKYSPEGILISEVISSLKSESESFSLEKIRDAIKANANIKKETKLAVDEMFKLAERWGVFSEKSTPISDLAKPGEITILDLSCYVTMPGGWDIKALVLGLVAKHLFNQRLEVRREEEFESINFLEKYFDAEEHEKKQRYPLVWLVIDEAHEFLPQDKITPATEPLITILREGRQPGISLVLASQQPGKIHTDVMTQSDTVISHRITAKIDVDALGKLAQSYMQDGLSRGMESLPRVKGAALVFDDMNERLHQIRVRPRLTWHGGSGPTAFD
jgi:uncharacterized protein